MYKRIENAQLKDQRVFLRVDFEKLFTGEEGFNRRVLSSLKPSVEFCLTRGANIIIASHTGNAENASRYDYKKVLPQMEELLGKKIHFLDIQQSSLKNSIEAIPAGEIVLLQNLLQHPSEAKNTDAFAKFLAETSDIYINEAFGSSIHSYTSLVKLPQFLPSYTGIAFQTEMETIQSMLSGKEHPLILIMGGVGLENKIKFIQKLFQSYNHVIDEIIIGGGIAFTFLKSRAHRIGNSTVEQNFEVNAFQLIERSELNETEIHLPVDHVVVEQISKDSKTKVQVEIDPPWRGIDIGPKTLSKFEKILKKAKFVLWYGPMGMVEVNNFSKGTSSLAKMIARSKARSIILGEDTVHAVEASGYADSMYLLGPNSSRVWMEYIRGNELPALTALKGVEE